MAGSNVRIVDVAKNAGVSPATVSRVLSNKVNVNKESVAAVLKSIEELNYKPNVIAQQLRSQKTNSVYVIVPDIMNSFFSPIIKGIEEEARSAGYDIYIIDSNRDEKIERAFVAALAKKQMDGVISLSATGAIKKLEEVAEGFPMVIAVQYFEESSLPNIGIDNVKASEDITNYLISLGHKDIGYISAYPNNALYRDRFTGYIKALADSGLDMDMKKVYYAATNSYESGYEATKKLLEGTKVSAICTSGDSIAIGAIKAIKEMGYSVPNDISVTGFDDLEYASFSNPSLTTVHQPMMELGKGAMQILKTLMDGKEISNNRIILSHSIVVRNSTSAFKGGKTGDL